jgi:hypothetical protein
MTNCEDFTPVGVDVAAATPLETPPLAVMDSVNLSE